jgi:hypothetical protein
MARSVWVYYFDPEEYLEILAQFLDGRSEFLPLSISLECHSFGWGEMLSGVNLFRL